MYDDELPSIEGTMLFRGYAIWYRIVGSGEDEGRHPLLILHGGPGATHQYLENLGALARSGRRVIFYDQVGCGRSEGPTDPDFYSVATFVDELSALRAHLQLNRVHLLGQSWGGMLAMQYALEQPEGLESIIVADSPADMHQWVEEANRLRTRLPMDVQRTLTAHEAAGTTSDPAYLEAVHVFFSQFVCRLDPWPEAFMRTAKALEEDGFVYGLMNGPSEFHVIGKLKDWSIVDQLWRIAVPTLLLSGRFDEATPAIVDTIAHRIAGSEWIVFESSSHTPHLEEPAAFQSAVRAFLSGLEQAVRTDGSSERAIDAAARTKPSNAVLLTIAAAVALAIAFRRVRRPGVRVDVAPATGPNPSGSTIPTPAYGSTAS